jgi:hypothetical protein
MSIAAPAHVKPMGCPRCGASATVWRHGEGWAVICDAVLCWLVGPLRPEATAAVAVWNTRPAAHNFNHDEVT